MNILEAEVVVVGSGLAGLSAALTVGEGGREVVLLTDAAGGGSSGASVMSGGNFRAPGPEYASEDMYLDIIRGGAYLPQRSTVKVLVEDAPTVRTFLSRYGVETSDTPTGFRAFPGAEAPGRRLLDCLEQALPDTVTKVSGFAWEALLGRDGSVEGLLAFDREKAGWFVIASSRVIVATGGASGVYRYTDNSLGATGDGVALAFRAGAPLADMEFVQFWPLAVVQPGGGGRCTCLGPGEMSRGTLLDGRGRDITGKVGLRGLADGRSDPSRVSRLIYEEATSASGPGRDGTASEDVPLRLLPGEGSPRTSGGASLPVTCAAHHTMGGVICGDHGQTRVPGLFVAGEVAAGAHGASRLSGTGLTEAVVRGRRAGSLVLASLPSRGAGAGVPASELTRQGRAKIQAVSALLEADDPDAVRPHEARRRVAEAMWRHVALVRSRDSLDAAQSEINKMKRALPLNVDLSDGAEVHQGLKVLNLLLVAEAITRSARYRRESRGVHYRSDFPGLDEAEGLRHVRVKLLTGEMSLEVSQGLELMEP
ncbi:MAG TPA: hypothetical protein DHW14_00260 [Clostridiales bacterium]|nr:hypothetical protein [Clostridiales bacterium]